MAQRTSIQVRVGDGGLAWLDGIAKDTSTSRSDVARAALKVAAKHEAEVLKILEDRL